MGQSTSFLNSRELSLVLQQPSREQERCLMAHEWQCSLGRPQRDSKGSGKKVVFWARVLPDLWLDKEFIFQQCLNLPKQN